MVLLWLDQPPTPVPERTPLRITNALDLEPSRDFTSAMWPDAGTIVRAARVYMPDRAWGAPSDIMHIDVTGLTSADQNKHFELRIADSKGRGANTHIPMGTCVSGRLVAIAVAAVFDGVDHQECVYVLDTATGAYPLKSVLIDSWRCSQPVERLASWLPYVSDSSGVGRGFATVVLLPPSAASTELRYVVCLARNNTIVFMRGEQLVARIKTAEERSGPFTKYGYFAGPCVYHDGTVYVLCEDTPGGVLAVRSFTCDGELLATVPLEKHAMASKPGCFGVGPDGCFVLTYENWTTVTGVLVYSASGQLVDRFKPTIAPDAVLPPDARLYGLAGLSFVPDRDGRPRIVLVCILSGRRQQLQIYDFKWWIDPPCPPPPLPLPPTVSEWFASAAAYLTPSAAAPPHSRASTSASSSCSSAVSAAVPSVPTLPVVGNYGRPALPRFPLTLPNLPASLLRAPEPKRPVARAELDRTGPPAKRVYPLRTRKPTQAQRPDDDYVYSDGSSSADEADHNYQ